MSEKMLKSFEEAYNQKRLFVHGVSHSGQELKFIVHFIDNGVMQVTLFHDLLPPNLVATISSDNIEVYFPGFEILTDEEDLGTELIRNAYVGTRLYISARKYPMFYLAIEAPPQPPLPPFASQYY
jgi:hypothetical protein